MKGYAILVSAALVLLCGSFAYAEKLERRDGGYRGMLFIKYDLPVFTGEMPAEFPYKGLGKVEGRCQKQSLFGQIADRKGVMTEKIEAHREMIKNAISLGANAVINVKSEWGGDCHTTGEAVIFDKIPTSEEIKEYNKGIKKKDK